MTQTRAGAPGSRGSQDGCPQLGTVCVAPLVMLPVRRRDATHAEEPLTEGDVAARGGRTSDS